jgi:hypothetical protein
MTKRLVLSVLLLTAIVGPATAQETRGGVRTETMERQASQDSGMDLIWNVVGLLGLLGLLGLGREHPDDSYHPASME